MIDDILKIAQQAGARTIKHFGKKGPVTQKSDGSPLSLADQEANDMILEGLKKLTPEIPIISEESALQNWNERKSWSRFWLVDPLDGTAEFVDGSGEFTVNIALIEKNIPTLGVIYAPALKVLYWGQIQHGSWRQFDGKSAERIYSRDFDPEQTLSMAVSRRHAKQEIERVSSLLKIESSVGAGSSLKFCSVAEGKTDLYPRFGPTMEWDVAAGDCIYRNSTNSGQRFSPLTYNKPDLKNSGFVIGVSRDWFELNAELLFRS